MCEKCPSNLFWGSITGYFRLDSTSFLQHLIHAHQYRVKLKKYFRVKQERSGSSPISREIIHDQLSRDGELFNQFHNKIHTNIHGLYLYTAPLIFQVNYGNKIHILDTINVVHIIGPSAVTSTYLKSIIIVHVFYTTILLQSTSPKMYRIMRNLFVRIVLLHLGDILLTILANVVQGVLLGV